MSPRKYDATDMMNRYNATENQKRTGEEMRWIEVVNVREITHTKRKGRK